MFIGIKEVGSLTYRELIEANPSVMLGKPVIDGTRITVEMILEKVTYGETVDQILEEYPRLTREGVLAALQYALESFRDDPTPFPPPQPPKDVGGSFPPAPPAGGKEAGV